MSNIFKSMRPKKKRPVDPNAPPRPNLLSHEKVLKDTKSEIEQLKQDNQLLKNRLSQLEAKFANQTAYLSELHNFVNRSRK